MTVKHEKPPLERREAASRALETGDGTPISSSGVVVRSDERAPAPPRRRRRDSEPPSFRFLTPYQARLDVEMDDTAISKVRDPSVSIRLGDETAPPGAARGPARRSDAIAATMLGAALGVLLVLAVVLLIRACT